MPTQAELQAYLTKKYQSAGLDPRIGMAIVQIESGWNPNAKNKSGANGLMQFMPSTAKEYGINSSDPYQSIDASIEYLKKARKAGVNINDPAMAYLSWQQGTGGAAKLQKADPNASVESILGVQAARQNGGAGLTVAQFTNKWGSKARSLAGVGSGMMNFALDTTTLTQDGFADEAIHQAKQVEADVIKQSEQAQADLEHQNLQAQKKLDDSLQEMNEAQQKALQSVGGADAPDYSKQLAAAFGVLPDTKADMPDYLDPLLRQIYDQA